MFKTTTEKWGWGNGHGGWGLGVGGKGMGDIRNDKRRSDLEEECSFFSTDLTLQLNKSNNSFEVIRQG